MIVRMRLLVCFLWLVVTLAGVCRAIPGKPRPASRSIFSAARKKTSPKLKYAPAAKARFASRGVKTNSKYSVPIAGKGKNGRIPRTLRTLPVSPVVRETATARVERMLAETAASPFLYPSALKPFFNALSAEQADHAGAPGTASQTVRILQFGDSHTAADLFTGELRSRFQAQFGDGGLGFQFPGHPFAGYHLAGSTRSQTAGWMTEGNHFTALGDGELGLGGISIKTSQPDQTVTLESTCETLQLHFLRQASAGRLQFSDNGTPISVIETALAPEGSGLATNKAGSFTYACTAGTHEFRWTTLDAAPVKLLGVVTEQPGVTYECLGINGAVAPLMLRWDPTLFNEYLRQRAPKLIVLAYGTNEAGGSADGIANYPVEFAQLLDTLHRAVRDTSILVLGPFERDIASGRGRRRSWHPLGGVDRIIAIQKEVCRTHGCAFWDGRRRMGGPGSMPQWVAADLAQPDRTHLTGTGYRELADALYTDLIHAYNNQQQTADQP